MPDRRKGKDVEGGPPSGPRPFWSGSLTFGLVAVPVRLFSATRSGAPSLRMVDEGGAPLRQRWVHPESGRPVERDDIVRGYEVDSGEWVTVTEEELESLEPEKSREIDLRRFVPEPELDPVFFQRAYFLVPAEGGGKAYRLLAKVMEDTGRAGVATFVMRGREYLVAILARDGILRAETMRFHDEVRTPAQVGLPEPDAADGSLVKKLAAAMWKAERDTLDEAELEDVGASELGALVERKRRKGSDVVDLPAGAADGEDGEGGGGGRVIDLLDVLRRSLEGDTDLASLTKTELYERAQEKDVPGRSSMTKDELVEALRSA